MSFVLSRATAILIDAEMAPNLSSKRKLPTGNRDQTNQRSTKRVKLFDARKIIAQPPDKALNTNGDLDVAAFVKAREFEIRAMMKSMKQSKKVLSNRAFQQVPRQLRRRTASHNAKKVPKRLRVRAVREVRPLIVSSAPGVYDAEYAQDADAETVP